MYIYNIILYNQHSISAQFVSILKSSKLHTHNCNFLEDDLNNTHKPIMIDVNKYGIKQCFQYWTETVLTAQKIKGEIKFLNFWRILKVPQVKETK